MQLIQKSFFLRGRGELSVCYDSAGNTWIKGDSEDKCVGCLWMPQCGCRRSLVNNRFAGCLHTCEHVILVYKSETLHQLGYSIARILLNLINLTITTFTL